MCCRSKSNLDMPKSWNHIRGPIGAVKLSLARIGWKAAESFLSFEGPDEMAHTFLDSWAHNGVFFVEAGLARDAWAPGGTQIGDART